MMMTFTAICGDIFFSVPIIVASDSRATFAALFSFLQEDYFRLCILFLSFSWKWVLLLRLSFGLACIEWI
jgi:hypothetical protein